MNNVIREKIKQYKMQQTCVSNNYMAYRLKNMDIETANYAGQYFILDQVIRDLEAFLRQGVNE